MEIFKPNSQRKRQAKIVQIAKNENVNNSDERDVKKGNLLPQFTACICGFIVYINNTIINVWTSPALPYLKSNQSEFHISDSQGAWIAALPNLSAIIGILIFPLFIDKIGRKHTMLIFAILQGIGTVCVILSKNYIHLYLSRIIAGIGSGGGHSTTIVYFGEIANKEFRGTIMTITCIFAKISSLFIAIAGAYLSYHTMNVTLVFVSVSFLLFFLFMPETPHFYLMQGKDSKAVKTLMKLRGVNNPEDVATDIQRMKKSICNNRQSVKKVLKEMFSKNSCRRSLIVVLLAKVALIYSGITAILAYSQEILSESGSSLAPTNAAMILAAMDIIAIMPTTQFIDRFRRRPLFLVSGILTGLSLGIVGFYFFLKFYLQFDVSSVGWLPLTGLVLFQFSCNIGLTILPMVFLAELFPLSVKSAAVAFTNIASMLFAFSSKLAFQALVNASGIYMPFFIFGGCCISGSCIVFWIAPETKGKSLEEIQDILEMKKNKRDNLIQDVVED